MPTQTEPSRPSTTSHSEKSVESENMASAAQDAHPRQGMPEWKWKGTLVVIYLTAIINGYDVSNVANIQPRLYKAFGHIEVLPWIGLSFSLASFAVLALARKIMYCFDMRWIWIINAIIFLAGAAVAGSAESISAVIVGRVIMGVGGSIVQHISTSYFAVYATPAETPRLFGTMSGLWATGLVVGGPIGSALAENPDTTWRWAFYMNLPWVGLALALGIVCIPSHSIAPKIPLWRRITKVDPLGVALQISATVLFAIAVTFSGSVWSWSSGGTIAVWVLFGGAFVFWVLQQYFCIFTTAQERAFPLHMLSRRDLLPIWMATACAGAAYAVTLYYTPLFFAFARGLDSMDQTVRMLPFIVVFIVSVILVGGSLSKIRQYNLIYVVGGAVTLAASTAMAATLDMDVSQSHVMGLIALIGIGLGCHFQHGTGISNVINKNQNDRFDSVIICNMAQMGGIAVVLSIAGAIFQNVGYSFLTDALPPNTYTEKDIREALAGVSSVVWQSKDEEMLRRGVEAVTKVIAREFYLVVASGALCLICGLLMKWEKLDYSKKKSEGESVV